MHESGPAAVDDPVGTLLGDAPGSRRAARLQQQPPARRGLGLPTVDLASALSRRNLLIGAATAGTAATGISTMLLRGSRDASTSTIAAPTPTGSALTAPGPSAAPTTTKPSPTAQLVVKVDPELLIRRATYGATPTLVADLAKLGTGGWLARQLKPASIRDPGGDDVARRFPRLGWSTSAVRGSLQDGAWDVMFDLGNAHLARALWSERQLLEVMVDFWSNHLNVTCPSGDVWDCRHRYDSDVIRKYALANFEDMLQASAVHPAMLRYLNNADSTPQMPNENYARELLELHTVGIDGGYTEGDVQRAALLLTGWTVDEGKPSYQPGQHHVGSVRVMGFRHPNSSRSGGKAAQQAYLSYLAHHPRTAQRIASKLVIRFVSDDPPAALVNRLAAIYLKSRTAIPPVLTALFTSPEFAESGGLKMRRPFERLAASVRALGIRPGTDSQGISDLYWMLNGVGHVPLAWPQPDGYPDVAAAWQSPAAALSEFNTATALIHGWWPDKLKLPGPQKLLSSSPTTATGVIDAVARKLLGRKATSQERSAAKTMLAGTKLGSSFPRGSRQQQETIALVGTLLLSSPAHFVR